LINFCNVNPDVFVFNIYTPTYLYIIKSSYIVGSVFIIIHFHSVTRGSEYVGAVTRIPNGTSLAEDISLTPAQWGK